MAQNKKKRIAKSVDMEIDPELQQVLWDMYELLKDNRKKSMNAIQFFDVFKVGDYLVIKNKQFNPVMNDKLKLIRPKLHMDKISIMIIESNTEEVMLFPSNC